MISDTISQRQEKDRDALLAALQEVPIIGIACKKAGIARATFYRWCEEDIEFKDLSYASRRQGIAKINDMSESQLLKLIQEGKMPAIVLWLKSHHEDYAPRTDSTPTRAEIRTKERQERLSERNQHPNIDDPRVREIVRRAEDELRQLIVEKIKEKND